MPSLVVLVMLDLSQCREVLSAWHEAGATATTIVDSTGTRSAKERVSRDDLPVLPSLKDLLQPDETPRKIVFSVVADDVVDRVIQATMEVVGDLAEPGKGILFVLPVTRVMGLRGNPPSGS